MTLYDIQSPDQFKAYYEANNLINIEDKIANLKKEMKILATRGDYETKEEELEGLEEVALLGVWKAT